jgi:hypothetical protein
VQHALARMWYRNFGGRYETGVARTDRVLRLEDYRAVGGLKGRSEPNRHRARPGGSTASALLGTSEVAQQPFSPTVVPSLRRRDERPGTSEVAQKPLNHPDERSGESPEAAPSPDVTRSGNALSQHADEAYFSLSDGASTNEDRGPNHKPSRKQMIAQMLFRCLAERGPSGQYVRRPVKVQDVAAVAGCSVAEVIDVVDVFRREDRSFLTPAKPKSDGPYSLLKNVAQEGEAPAEPQATSDFPHSHGSAGASPSRSNPEKLGATAV